MTLLVTAIFLFAAAAVNTAVAYRVNRIYWTQDYDRLAQQSRLRAAFLGLVFTVSGFFIGHMLLQLGRSVISIPNDLLVPALFIIVVPALIAALIPVLRRTYGG